MALLEAGGDFADGVIAFEGVGSARTLLISFDKKAVKLMEAARRVRAIAGIDFLARWRRGCALTTVSA